MSKTYPRKRGATRLLFAFMALAAMDPVLAKTRLLVAYAGSMGVVMDQDLGPAFCRLHHCTYEGQGQGAYGLAHRILAHTLTTDVFISVTAGPYRILKNAGLTSKAYPVASTQMVIAYSPKSPYASAFQRAARGLIPWYQILARPDISFGRTDPATDPQGQNIVFTLQLAARYYHKPGLVRAVLGRIRNPRQIFSEPSLLARLQAGELAASSSYLSTVRSWHLPYITLPPEINLGNPRFARSWYRKAHISLAIRGREHTFKPEALVFYATVPHDAAHPRLGHAFVHFLQSARAQRMFHAMGYDRPHGGPLS